MQERTSRKKREDQIEQGRPPLTEYDAELGQTYGKPDDGTRDPSMEDQQDRRGGGRPESAQESDETPGEPGDED